MPRRRPRNYLTKLERRIEHQRRRAKLKAALMKDPEGASKTERPHERWDKWAWD